MSKAVLVMDMPDGCSECGFCGCDGDRCFILNEEIPEQTYIDGEKREDCPLRKMPKRKNSVDEEHVDCYTHYQVRGWNACIDAIEGRWE